MIHNFSRRQFMFGCLGFFPTLGAAAKSPQVSIPSVVANLPQREEEERADAIRSQVSNPSDFPKPKFHFGQEVEHTLVFDDGEISVETGTVIGLNYELSDRKQLEWQYLIAWTNCCNLTHGRAWTPDQDEPSFVFESELQAG
ncbi:MAG TPA: hypothetical protein V6D09_12325 [Leptolyngbyaceae cyanobacterium]